MKKVYLNKNVMVTEVLTKRAAYDPEFGNIISRDIELDRLITILQKRQKNIPVLMGPVGSGRSAIVTGLARRIADGKIPLILRNTKIVKFLSDTPPEMLGEYLTSCERQPEKTLVFLPNLGKNTTEESTGDDSGMELFKTLLNRKSQKVFVIVTMEDEIFETVVSNKPSLMTEITPIKIVPTSEAVTRAILGQQTARYQIPISNKVLDELLRLTQLYVGDGVSPGKEIAILDDAFSLINVRKYDKTPRNLQCQISAIRNLLHSTSMTRYLTQCNNTGVFQNKNLTLSSFMESQLSNKSALELKEWVLLNGQASDFTVERRSSQTIKFLGQLKTKFYSLLSQEHHTNLFPLDQNEMNLEVTLDDVATVLSEKTGTPLKQLTTNESQRLLNLEDVLHERVIGQDVAVSQVVRAIRRARVGLKNPRRPIASFIFAGTTGVGKTELAKSIAERFFGKEEALIRFDMSEFMSKSSISRLIGSPPGFVGYDEGGQLTDKVKDSPYSLVLFDEIEKAHPDVFNLLLQVLEDGHLTDSKGHKVRFSETLIILTTNLGAKELLKRVSGTSSYGSGETDHSTPEEIAKAKAEEYEKLKGLLTPALEKHFRPEFLNRLDDTIIFAPLKKVEVRKIAELMLSQTKKRLAEQNIKLDIADSFKTLLLEEGYDPIYGARPLRRALSRLLEDRIAEKLITAGPHHIHALTARVNSSGQVVIEENT